MKKLRFTLPLTLGLVLGIGLAIKINVFAKETKHTIPIKELQNFSRIFKSIKQNYVNDVDDKDLINEAISGMVSSLDPHSVYLLPDSFNELTISTSGKFGGLGIEVGMEDGFVKVISPIDDTPAMKAGIKAGDLIIRIDDKTVKGMTLNEAVKLMRGEIGTEITITIIRENTNKPLAVKIIRDEIKIRSVKSRLLEPNMGYLRISQFQSRTKENLAQEVDKLVKANGGQDLKGLILDLRNNPGGVLNAAIDVSDTFINKGKIVYTEGRNPKSKSEFYASKNTLLPDISMVVIINGGSASASEIVAGALQDHKRAIIIGTQSFGKGSVQTVIPIGNNSAGLKITTAHYYTPLGRSIQAKGITPDIEAKPVEIKTNDDDPSGLLTISEKNYSGHLKNPDKRIPRNSNKDTPNKTAENLLHTDFVLYEALNLLKGMTLVKSAK